jgi:hypothetical protein
VIELGTAIAAAEFSGISQADDSYVDLSDSQIFSGP